MQELLKKIRESVNYSQIEMADELGVSFGKTDIRFQTGLHKKKYTIFVSNILFHYMILLFKKYMIQLKR